MHRLTGLVSIAMLAGCAAEAPPVAPVFRDASVQIASTTRLDVGDLLGEWWVVADFAPRSTCAPKLRFDPGPASDTLLYRPCPERVGPGPFDLAQDPEGAVYAVGAYGRLISDDGQIWVLWIAEDGGTAVIGAPSGRFGRILNRGPDIRPDRLRAAREVLAFNGYDLRRLQTVAR